MFKSLLNVAVVCILLLLPVFRAKCQVTPAGARSISMAGVSSVLEDAWAVFNNPAGLARHDHLSTGTCLEQRFLMKELGYYGMTLAMPVGKGSMGISALFSGHRSYIDQKISLSYGRLFGRNVLSGISLVYIYQKAGSEILPLHQVSYELGTIVLLSEKIKLGFSTFNPLQLYYKNKDYATLPSVFNLGLSYQYNGPFCVHAELEKDLDSHPRYKIGCEYAFTDIFTLRCGIGGFPASYSFGAALYHQRFLIEFASCYHQYLGFTPAFNFQFDFR